MMAGDGEAETEYESDPEEAKLSLKMRRRREASDDEDEAVADEPQEKEIDVRRDRPPSRAGIESDVESDGQGAAADYDDEELDVGELEEEGEEEYYEEEEEGVVLEEYEGGQGGIIDEISSGGMGGREAVGAETETGRAMGEGSEDQEPIGDDHVEGEKKENEPFAVPTAGAFYMHDDRFRENAAGRHRRTFGGRKLWESKDDRKWGHDKFEEMNMREKQYEERRSSKVQYRGRGRARGTDRGYARGGRSRAYNGSSNQNAAPKTVRGRGPRRYQPLSKNRGEGPLVQNNQSTKSRDNQLANTGRFNKPTPNFEPEPVSVKKVASSLNSASPPFYPSGSSSQEVTVAQKRDGQTGSDRSTRPLITKESFSISQPNSVFRGKNVVDSVEMDKLYINETVSSASSKHLGGAPTYVSMNVTQAPPLRSLGRGISVSGPASSHSSLMHNQMRNVPVPVQAPAAQRNHVNRGQSSSALIQPLSQRPTSSSQGSQGSPPRAAGLSITTSEPEDMESPLESSKSKTALVSKGKGTIQGGGRGSIMYSSPQVIGSSGHGDQNIPAYFPVMQFGGQPGVPALGMAFPGFVGNPQLGSGNSEMTWLPVLAGPAGPLGATYPYLAGGAYHGRPTAQNSALAGSSKDTDKASNNDLKLQQRSEPTTDELNQRQNKPRRYSEMNFGQ